MNKQITFIIGASIFLMAEGNVLAADSALPDAPSWAESQKHISYDEFMKAAKLSFPFCPMPY